MSPRQPSPIATWLAAIGMLVIVSASFASQAATSKPAGRAAPFKPTASAAQAWQIGQSWQAEQSWETALPLQIKQIKQIKRPVKALKPAQMEPAPQAPRSETATAQAKTSKRQMSRAVNIGHLRSIFEAMKQSMALRSQKLQSPAPSQSGSAENSPKPSELRSFGFPIMKACEIRVGIVEPDTGEAKGDVLFLHGYGDTLENHERLFHEWSRRGLRVVSFDYPSHGKSRCDRLDLFTFQNLMELVVRVEDVTREQGSVRPLVLAGWSTGGLLATRLVQDRKFKMRPVSGLILLTPAIAQSAFVGRDGHYEMETLTRDSSFAELEWLPESPFSTPVFAAHLSSAREEALIKDIPSSLPVLAFLAGEQEDLYIKTKDVKDWMLEQRAKKVPLVGFQCAKAYHALDFEPPPVGSTVRHLAGHYAAMIALGKITATTPVETVSRAFSTQTCPGF